MQIRGSESVYQRVMEGDWDDLDPRLRAYFGPMPPGCVGVGRGIFHTVGSRWPLLRMLLAGTARWGILFPEFGHDVPFRVENSPHPNGSLTATRSFFFRDRTRVLRDTVAIEDGRLIERFGTDGVLALDLAVAVERGGMRLVSRGLSLRWGSLSLPLPRVARVTVYERAEGVRQRVDVRVRSPLVGEIFRYTGSFVYEHVRVEEDS